MLTSPPPDRHLPPAVPGFAPDLDTALRELGRAHLYIAQLSAELVHRAREANDLHDELLAARERIASLLAEQQCSDGSGDLTSSTRE